MSRSAWSQRGTRAGAGGQRAPQQEGGNTALGPEQGTAQTLSTAPMPGQGTAQTLSTGSFPLVENPKNK